MLDVFMRPSRPLFVLLTAMWLGGPAIANEPLPQPEGRVILTVQGEVAVTNRGDAAVFDRETLRAVGWREVATYTPFGEGRQSFGGVALSALLDRLGAGGEVIHARALNDYVAKLPVDHAAEHDVLLAMDLEGEPMSVRERGPIWIIYPSERPLTDGELHYASLMVWQLHELTVR